MPDVFDVINVPGFRYFSTSVKTDCLMSSRSITTSITQSQSAISFMLSVKFPVLIFFTTSFVNTGEGLLFKAAAKASFTILFLLFASVASFGAISNNKTCNPMPAK